DHVVGDQHLAHARDRGGFGGDAGAARPGHQYLHLAELRCRRDGVQRCRLERFAVVFGEDQDRHQITRASFLSLSTSSATEPSFLPAWRFGGSATLSVVSRGLGSTPSASGVSCSMGFFFAFMMLGSEA